jgi:ABC-type multidrug transport system fused ATPase/permease subunit
MRLEWETTHCNQADVVYVIKDGKVTEAGLPDELKQNEGWFSRFMRSAEEAMPATELEPTSN